MFERIQQLTSASKLLATGVAGFALLVAQVIAFAHDTDPNSHAPDHVCEICITAADLSGADVGQPSSYLDLSQPLLESTLAATPAKKSHIRWHSARAPPAAA